MEGNLLHTTAAQELLPPLRQRASAQEHRNYLDLTFSVYCHYEREGLYSHWMVVSIYEEFNTFHNDVRRMFDIKDSSCKTTVQASVPDYDSLTFNTAGMIPTLRRMKELGGSDCFFALVNDLRYERFVTLQKMCIEALTVTSSVPRALAEMQHGAGLVHASDSSTLAVINSSMGG